MKNSEIENIIRDHFSNRLPTIIEIVQCLKVLSSCYVVSNTSEIQTGQHNKSPRENGFPNIP
jgi:hypothetical protein